MATTYESLLRNNDLPRDGTDCIYILQCGGAVYVGQTQHIADRLSTHFRNAHSKSTDAETKLIYQKIREKGLAKTKVTIFTASDGYRFGIDQANFTRFQTEWSPARQKNEKTIRERDELDIAEILWINHFAYNKGLSNVSMGGQRMGWYHNDGAVADGKNKRRALMRTDSPTQAAIKMAMEQEDAATFFKQVRQVYEYIFSPRWKEVAQTLGLKGEAAQTFNDFIAHNEMMLNRFFTNYTYQGAAGKDTKVFSDLKREISTKFVKNHVIALQQYYDLKDIKFKIPGVADLWDLTSDAQLSEYVAQFLKNVTSSLRKKKLQQLMQKNLDRLTTKLNRKLKQQYRSSAWKDVAAWQKENEATLYNYLLKVLKDNPFEPVNVTALVDVDRIRIGNLLRNNKSGGYTLPSVLSEYAGADDFKRRWALAFFNRQMSKMRDFGAIVEDLLKRQGDSFDSTQLHMSWLTPNNWLSHRLKTKFNDYPYIFNHWWAYYRPMVSWWRVEAGKQEIKFESPYYVTKYKQYSLLYRSKNIAMTGSEKALQIY